MNNIETMKMALEALERCVATCFDQYAHHQVMSRPEHFVNQTITALRQAIEQAQQAEPWEKFCDSNCVWTDHHPNCKLAQQAEPVAWMDDEMTCIFFDVERPEPFDFDFWKPLYTSPPPRQWVGLTDEEIDDIEATWEATQEWVSFRHATRVIEAKLKEKNT